ncbi:MULTISPECIES: hypothetical protein [unclassified Streptomyces]|uniref:hypothetical protein n=1 Tax=unclassified Streptomyces TaxID=2593676 RepID=UPI00068C6ECD|nr:MULTISPECIES: hypothetical protein [unclassified Streptomyces]KOV75877.1 hypothetical protein ADL02_33075 [Streptomyces sp. NRRL WC-3723]
MPRKDPRTSTTATPVSAKATPVRLCRPLAAVLGGLALALTATGSALAADGTFIWIGPQGKAYALDNPPDDKCLDMAQEARGARNGTKKPLVVYTKKRCKGSALRLAPGRSAPANARFASVVFSPR